jgi:hypothetical protein
MMRGLRAMRGSASLFVVGCVLAAGAAALTTTNGAPTRTDSCRPVGALDVNTDGNDTADVRVCPNAGNSVSDASDIRGGNAVRDDTGANANADTGKADEPGDTTAGLPAKPQRATILSRSWRQIFPRAN